MLSETKVKWPASVCGKQAVEVLDELEARN